MTLKMHFLLTLMLLSLWSACTRERAGVISETTNGATLSGRLASGDGNPRAGAVVELRSINDCDGCIGDRLFSKMTDTDGGFVFGDVEPGSYVVYSSPATDSAAGLNVTVPRGVYEVELPEAVLQTTDSLCGTVSFTDGSYPESVSLLGTGLNVSVDRNGGYSFGQLPRMERLFRIVSENTEWPTAIVPESVLAGSDTFIVKEVKTAVLDDFNDDRTDHLLYPFTGTGSWYLKAPDGITVTPSSVVTDFSRAFTIENAWNKQSLTLEASVSQENEDALFIVGMEIGNGYAGSGSYCWFDLSSMSAFSFMARGEGTLRVLFLSRFVKENYSGADHFEKQVVLSETWDEYRITPADLVPPDGSDAARDEISWERAADNIAEITFIATQSVAVSLDDITIEGLTFLDLIASGNR